MTLIDLFYIIRECLSPVIVVTLFIGAPGYFYLKSLIESEV